MYADIIMEILVNEIVYGG